jgi:hypothetical protein
MARAFHSLSHHAPKGFSLQIIDNEHFLTVKASEKQFMKLLDRDKRMAIQYMVMVKKALEDNGATVLVIRKSLDGKNG